MLDAKLVIIGGADLALEYSLTLPTTIGRGKENDIPLAHPLVSRRHCELFEEDGLLFVRDNGSLNGTFVGNQPVEETSLLKPGQLLTIGTVTFRAVYNGVDSADVLDDEVDLPLGAGSGLDERVLDASETMIQPKAATQQAEAQPASITDTARHQAGSGDTERIGSRPRPPKR